MKDPKIIISGGGTGGHIFPAIAIANAIKEQLPDAQILFVGAEGKMEMERVPKAGYEIIGLPIRGFQRKQPLTFWDTLKRLFKSLRLAKHLLQKEQPAVVVGVGGYASAAVLYEAGKIKIPTLIQEQNSYPGLTNKILAKRVQKICVAYDKMERFFPADKLIFTGNPIRQDLLEKLSDKKPIYDYYQLDSSKKTVLVVGGSL
ncbi:MAG: glycosyltransferase, partial [Flavobacteriaceae bacterium]|nr:glycosyltransferase [Flavobacteriaceae bacterium]